MNGLEGIAFKGLWVIARHLPGFLLRMYFTKQRLADLVYVDIRPRHDPVMVNLAPPASATVYLQIINLGPVPVELDRAEFRLVCGGHPIKTILVRKQTFPVGEICWLYFQEGIQDSQAEHISRFAAENTVLVDGHIEFNCSVQQFSKTVPALEGVRPHFLNQNFWSQKHP
ncbi:MAG: hypothetical protein JWQ07_4044 [Ramlibacter sp.]|nr:hypothetical protein [Ramlibacter sp.]